MGRNEMNYYTAQSRRRRKSSRGAYTALRTGGASRDAARRGFSILDWLMMIVSVGVAAGFALSWMSRWVHPAAYGVMSATGLVAPVLFATNFICLLYWLLRMRLGVWVPLAVFVVGVWNVTLFFKPSLTRQYADHASDRSLVGLVSYNVRGMLAGEGGRLRPSTRLVAGVVDSLRPDVLCLQEFSSTAQAPAAGFEALLPTYNYKTVRGDFSWGNAIYSKFPIARSGLIEFDGTSNSILWADVVVRRDTVRVFNAHLQTTAVKADDEQYLVGMGFVGDDTSTSRLKGILGRLRGNYIIRAAQADTLARRIDASPHPVVVCGDFNDTPVSWAYRHASRGLKDSFREAGRGYGHTYRGFFDLLRIDYVLHSRSMECVEYASPLFDNSDHNPVAVRLRLHPVRR